MELGSQRVGLGLGSAQDLDVVLFRVLDQHFHCLALSRGSHELSPDAEGGGSVGIQDGREVFHGIVDDHLQAFHLASIVKVNKD